MLQVTENAGAWPMVAVSASFGQLEDPMGESRDVQPALTSSMAG
jgi:hypothetical protein